MAALPPLPIRRVLCAMQAPTGDLLWHAMLVPFAGGRQLHVAVATASWATRAKRHNHRRLPPGPTVLPEPRGLLAGDALPVGAIGR